MAKKKIISCGNRKEIFYNLVNSGLAGALVFAGSLTNGFSWEGICAGVVAALIVAITKFKQYWDEEKKEYTNKLFNFIQM